MSQVKICVLMSTYNGEKYIRDQLDSIINQEGVTVEILIRDDGSSDDTLNIVHDYQLLNKNISLIAGKNCGPKNSFFKLIKNAPLADFYAFSDQDDIWDPDKLQEAAWRMKNKDSPCCYFSNYRLVDKNNNLIKENSNDNQHVFKLADCLYRNPAPGCTIVFNRQMKDLITKDSNPQNTVMHDRWLMLLGYLTGDCIYDPIPRISYRQHENNAIGYGERNKNILEKICNIVFLKRTIPIESEIAELREYYCDDIPSKYTKTIENIANYQSSLLIRLRLLFDPNLSCEKISTGLILRLRMLLRRM